MEQSQDSVNEFVIQERIGLKIRELRKSVNMSSTALSGQIGISQGQLSKIENGKVSISIKILSQLCQVFQRPLNYFFQEDDRILQVLGTLNVDEGPEKEGFTWFAEEIGRSTRGRITFVMLEACQIGHAGRQVDFLRQGIIDLFIEDLDHFERLVPDLAIFSFPYAFTTVEHQLRFLSGPLFNVKIKKPLKKKGVRFINPSWNWFRGSRRVLVSGQPIFSPEDIKGKTVRVYESEVLTQYWRDLGAIPVTVPWPEVRDAMQNGEIDVLPTHHAMVHSLGFCRHARFVTHIGDMPAILGVAMNETKYQLLSPENQANVKKACLHAGDRFSGLVKEMEDKNEDLTMKDFDAVYINTGSDPWKCRLDQTRETLIRQGLLSPEIWHEVLRTR